LKIKEFRHFLLVFEYEIWYTKYMENSWNSEQLNSCDKSILITLILSQQEIIKAQTAQIEDLNRKMDNMLETLAIMRNDKFGRKSEAGMIDENQLNFFNEMESEAEKFNGVEPIITEVVPSYTRKKKGKRKEDLSGFKVTVVPHDIPEEELKKLFPNGYKHMPDEVYTKLEFHPATYEVLEHHIKVYAEKNGDRIVRASHPKEMLDKSIATPSLTAAIINAKYTNAVPLYRQEKEFERNEVHISRQVMANWVIRASERYISLVYDRMKDELLKSPVTHADETPVLVNKDGRKGTHKNYMWVYRTGEKCDMHPVVIYDYKKERKAEHPREFLNGYKGTLVCDGYQVYHSLSAERPDELKVAGCWTHSKRFFTNAIKAAKKNNSKFDEKKTLAYDAATQIANIYHVDNLLSDLTPEERLEKRQITVKPLVEAFFAWVKSHRDDVLPESATGKGFTYCLNQETYLKQFLNDGLIPLDNNAAERAIRPFCIGKKNWEMIDTTNGAEASAMLYSIVETCKANDIKIYEYLEHILTEIPKYVDGKDDSFLNDMLPWSEKLPEKCRKKKTETQKISEE